MGISSIKSISGTASLGLWNMSEPWEEMRKKVNLPEAAFAPLENISRAQRKKEWLACRLLLQEMTGAIPLIEHDANRKPSAVHYPGYVSFSHSGDFAAVYIDSAHSVGIDIQQMTSSISKGMDYYLNEEEQDWVDAGDNILLYLIWSAKEAAFKYAGRADFDMRKHFTVKPFTSNRNGSFEVCINKQEGGEKICIAYEIFEDYVLTWTSQPRLPI